MADLSIPLDSNPNVDPSPDLDSAMDSFLSGAPPAPEGANPEGRDGADPQAEPVGNQGADNADPEQDDNPPAEGAEGADASDLPEDLDAPIDTTGKTHIRVDAKRWNNVYGNHQFAKEIREIIPDVQTARNYQQRHNDLLDMKADLASGDPQAIDRFLNFWMKEAPQGAQSLVSRAIESAPAEMRDQIRTSMLESTIEEAYQNAVQTGDPNDIYRAQMLDYTLTGKYRAKDALPKPPDPLAEREAAVARREQALQQQGQQSVQQTVSRIESQVEGAKTQSLTAEVDKVLAPVKDKFAAAPKLFDALRKEILSQVRGAVEKDAEWHQSHQRDLRLAKQALTQAVQGRQKFDVKGQFQPLVDQYTARARGLIAATAKDLVKEATAILVGKNQQTHDKLNQNQNRRGVSGGGAPSKQSLLPNLPKDASLDQKMDAFFAAGR